MLTISKQVTLTIVFVALLVFARTKAQKSKDSGGSLDTMRIATQPKIITTLPPATTVRKKSKVQRKVPIISKIITTPAITTTAPKIDKIVPTFPPSYSDATTPQIAGVIPTFTAVSTTETNSKAKTTKRYTKEPVTEGSFGIRLNPSQGLILTTTAPKIDKIVATFPPSYSDATTPQIVGVVPTFTAVSTTESNSKAKTTKRYTKEPVTEGSFGIRLNPSQGLILTTTAPKIDKIVATFPPSNSDATTPQIVGVVPTFTTVSTTESNSKAKTTKRYTKEPVTEGSFGIRLNPSQGLILTTTPFVPRIDKIVASLSSENFLETPEPPNVGLIPTIAAETTTETTSKVTTTEELGLPANGIGSTPEISNEAAILQSAMDYEVGVAPTFAGDHLTTQTESQISTEPGQAVFVPTFPIFDFGTTPRFVPEDAITPSAAESESGSFMVVNNNDTQRSGGDDVLAVNSAQTTEGPVVAFEAVTEAGNNGVSVENGQTADTDNTVENGNPADDDNTVDSPVVSKPQNYPSYTDIKDLYAYILTDYDTRVRPKYNQSQVTKVSVFFSLLNILDFKTSSQTFDIVGYFYFVWKDEFLVWKPRHYSRTQWTKIPIQDIWTPQLMIANMYEGDGKIGDKTDRALVTFQGTVMWVPEATYNLVCEVAIEFYPFDTQTCRLTFYVSDELMSEVELFVDEKHQGSRTDHYMENSEWRLLKVSVEKYFASGASYMDVTFIVQRRLEFIFMTTIAPLLLVSVLNLCVFLIPVEAEQKGEYSSTIVITYGVFISHISASVPPNSTTIPYFVLYMIWLLGFSVSTVIYSIIQSRLFTHYGKRRMGMSPFSICFGKKVRVKNNRTGNNMAENNGLNNGIGNINENNEEDENKNGVWGDMLKKLDIAMIFLYAVSITGTTAYFFHSMNVSSYFQHI